MTEVKTVTGWTVISQLGFSEMIARYDPSLFGDSNTAPANFRHVSEEEFAQDHDHMAYSALALNYRQLTRLNDGTALPKRIHGTLYINSFGKGWMIEQCYHEKKVRYYFFDLCQHEYETIEQARCWWKGKCKKCGMIHAVDSSD